MAKPTPQPDDPAQFQRFVDLATEFEADASSEALARAVKKIAPQDREKPNKSSKARKDSA